MIDWRKSSRSGTHVDGDCVEVGVWRKSTHSSTTGGDYVEIAVREERI